MLLEMLQSCSIALSRTSKFFIRDLSKGTKDGGHQGRKHTRAMSRKHLRKKLKNLKWTIQKLILCSMNKLSLSKMLSTKKKI